jgi:hypothetical protein
MPEPLDYKSPSTQAPSRKRTPATWALLIAVWIVGVVMWAMYISLAAVLMIRLI